MRLYYWKGLYFKWIVSCLLDRRALLNKNFFSQTEKWGIIFCGNEQKATHAVNSLPWIWTVLLLWRNVTNIRILQCWYRLNLNLIWIRHSHEEEIPAIIIPIDETGRLNEPHEKCLQALMVLSEPWTQDIHLKWWTADEIHGVFTRKWTRT